MSLLGVRQGISIWEGKALEKGAPSALPLLWVHAVRVQDHSFEEGLLLETRSGSPCLWTGGMVASRAMEPEDAKVGAREAGPILHKAATRHRPTLGRDGLTQPRMLDDHGPPDMVGAAS